MFALYTAHSCAASRGGGTLSCAWAARLAQECVQYGGAARRPLWVEAESAQIGRCRVPSELFEQMQAAPRVQLRVRSYVAPALCGYPLQNLTSLDRGSTQAKNLVHAGKSGVPACLFQLLCCWDNDNVRQANVMYARIL